MNVITSALGPFGPLIIVGLLGVMLIGVALMLMLGGKSDPMAKLNQTKNSNSGEKSKDRLRTAGRNDKLDKYASFLEPQNEKEYSAARTNLMQAGYRHRDAVRYFHFAQMILGIGLLVAGVIYYMLFIAGTDMPMHKGIMYILLPGAVGYMIPKYWVTKRKQVRQTEIAEAFPDSLDMMLTCVEAGQSMDQSIVRVADEIQSSYPTLAEEYKIVAHQAKAGRDKPTVLKEMADRCGVPDISSFTITLIQSQTFGTSIADALRVYSAEMRDKRVMRAEEKANKLPVKMTLVTMGLTVPPLMIILVGPSILGIMELM